jgi:hypothetical protein
MIGVLYSAASLSPFPRRPAGRRASSSRRYCPVYDSRTRATSSGVPCATMRPAAVAATQISSGFKPVRLAMRANITGPSSSSS